MECARELLSTGEVDVNRACNSFGRRAIHIAARNGSAAMLKMLLEEGAEPNALGESESDNAAHLAAWNGHRLVLDLLRDAGVDVSARNHRGETPAHLAARRGEIQVLRHLHRIGVDVLYPLDDSGRTPLQAVPNRDIADPTNMGPEQSRQFLRSLLDDQGRVTEAEEDRPGAPCGLEHAYSYSETQLAELAWARALR